MHRVAYQTYQFYICLPNTIKCASLDRERERHSFIEKDIGEGEGEERRREKERERERGSDRNM